MDERITPCHFSTQVQCFVKKNRPTFYSFYTLKEPNSLRHESHVSFLVDTYLCKQEHVQPSACNATAPNALYNILYDTTEFYFDLLSAIFQNTSQLHRCVWLKIIFCRRTRSEGREVYVSLFQFDWRLCVLYWSTLRFICDKMYFLAFGDPEGGDGDGW